MAEEDSVPYQDQPFDASKSSQLRRLNSGARNAEGALMAYVTPAGNRLAWTGDDEAPFVKVIHMPPAIFPVSTIPQANSSGVLVASTVGSSLHEAWITDSRDPLLLPAARWILLFDAQVAPTAGDIPSYAPIAMCTGGTTPLDFVGDPLGFANGIVIALSTTPNSYTAIGAASDYAITARILNAGG